MPSPKSSDSTALPFTLSLEDFKGDFSFDGLFESLVEELLPEFQEEESGSPGAEAPMFPAVDELLMLFTDSCKELVDLHRQVDTRLRNLKEEVAAYDAADRKALAKVEKVVDGLFNNFARLDSRISTVGQTAARIGDQLQSAESQRETANRTIEHIKYLMEFNSSPGDLIGLSPLFSDDSRVAEAASVALKLRSYAEEDVSRHGAGAPLGDGDANASSGLEVAVANLQDYCNELENRLLSRFDAASQRQDLPAMAQCAKILSQFNRGTSAMQHYVGSRPMFIDVEVMNTDIKLVLDEQDSQTPGTSNIADGLSSLYKEITGTIRYEAETVIAVFPSPDDVMSIFVQRVLEQRVTAILDKLLVRPSLNIPPIQYGGLLQYLRILALTYGKTQELAKELRSVGCGNLDVEGLTESFFLPHKDDYVEIEQASLEQLYQLKMEELRAEVQQQSESTGIIKSKEAFDSSKKQISITIIKEFVHWNEEAISRCTLFSSQPAMVAANVRSVFTCLLDQVSQYLIEGLEHARESLTEAAALRDRIGASVKRWATAEPTSAVEAASAAGESSFRCFMIAVQQSGNSLAIVHQYFSNAISPLLPVHGSNSCEEMTTAVSSIEAAAHKGLLQCLDTVMAEVERLSSEQRPTDYRAPDDGTAPDHRPTDACIRVVSYLSRVLEGAFNALEGLNKQSFLTELGNRLHKGLLTHWQKFIFSPSGGLRLKRDITEYGEFIRRFIQLRDDYKTAKIAAIVNSITS
ncbi:exocyst complex component 5-like isoform X3 [Typha latifolia]|uniref:exocyst complex component 5-like isoform X3 n=1 Tax=Typha latifolia TaxID=4733 RepID=UPI003C2C35E7